MTQLRSRFARQTALAALLLFSPLAAHGQPPASQPSSPPRPGRPVRGQAPPAAKPTSAPTGTTSPGTPNNPGGRRTFRDRSRGAGSSGAGEAADGATADSGASTAGRAASRNPAAGDAANAAEDSSLYACDKAKGRFKVNLAPDVELKDLVTWAFSFTCKNFIYSSAIGTRAAKVTIKSPESMNARQAWSVFLVALQSMGLTVVPKGNVLEIVEYAQAKSAPLPIYTAGRPANSDQMVRAVLRPDHLPVDEVANILTEIKSVNGSVKSVPKAGVVVITDFGTHIGRMSSLMLAVDTPVMGERLYMLRVKYADAAEMAQTLSEILGTKDGSAPSNQAPPPPPRNRRGRDARAQPPQVQQAVDTGNEVEVESAVPSKILADERTNALILLASEPAYLRVKALVNRLDVSVEVEGAGRIHVYPLENADAEEMSTTLTAVISGIQQPPSGGGRSGRERPQAEPQRPSANADSAAAFEGQVRVTHDKPTNSLVVVASVKDFLALREVLRRLDVPRPQVYIEATIVEIGIDNSRDLGTAWHAGAEVRSGDLVVGGVQHSNLSSLNVATLATSTGLIGGALGSLLEGSQELLGTSIPSYGILLQALANTSNLDVLSSPHILTTDNEEAEISVGQNIPYQSALVGLPGGATGGAAGFFPTQSIQRQDVELNLKITPQINASNEVRLKIDLTINDIASQDFAGLGPSWSKKTLKDTIVVPDQQAVVLGGLISDKVTNSESKVPLLGDIPILGYLFKFTQKRKEKRNLLIVLTPYIVHNQTDLERIVERRIREQREFMRTFSTFHEVEYRPEIDFRRKRGLIAEVNRRVKQIEEETKVLQDLEQKQVGFPDGPVEYLPERSPEEVPPDGETPPEDGEGEPTKETSADADAADDAAADADAADADAAPAKAKAKAKAKKAGGKGRTGARGPGKKKGKGKKAQVATTSAAPAAKPATAKAASAPATP